MLQKFVKSLSIHLFNQSNTMIGRDSIVPSGNLISKFPVEWVIYKFPVGKGQTLLGSLRSTTRPAQRRGLNFSSRMSGKQFDYCKKYFTLFQITLQTATFG
jgi:hypothetical protein